MSILADIRSCLNSLQFIKAESSQKSRFGLGDQVRLSVESLAEMTIGLKDVTRDQFDVWRSTFQTPRTRRTALQQQLQA